MVVMHRRQDRPGNSEVAVVSFVAGQAEDKGTSQPIEGDTTL